MKPEAPKAYRVEYRDDAYILVTQSSAVRSFQRYCEERHGTTPGWDQFECRRAYEYDRWAKTAKHDVWHEIDVRQFAWFATRMPVLKKVEVRVYGSLPGGADTQVITAVLVPVIGCREMSLTELHEAGIHESDEVEVWRPIQRDSSMPLFELMPPPPGMATDAYACYGPHGGYGSTI
jgi:hypothetical protein